MENELSGLGFRKRRRRVRNLSGVVKRRCPSTISLSQKETIMRDSASVNGGGTV